MWIKDCANPVFVRLAVVHVFHWRNVFLEFDLISDTLSLNCLGCCHMKLNVMKSGSLKQFSLLPVEVYWTIQIKQANELPPSLLSYLFDLFIGLFSSAVVWLPSQTHQQLVCTNLFLQSSWIQLDLIKYVAALQQNELQIQKKVNFSLLLLLLLLQRSTAVQVKSSVRLMPQNQPSGRGLLPSPTAWLPD